MDHFIGHFKPPDKFPRNIPCVRMLCYYITSLIKKCLCSLFFFCGIIPTVYENYIYVTYCVML